MNDRANADGGDRDSAIGIDNNGVDRARFGHNQGFNDGLGQREEPGPALILSGG